MFNCSSIKVIELLCLMLFFNCSKGNSKKSISRMELLKALHESSKKYYNMNCGESESNVGDINGCIKNKSKLAIEEYNDENSIKSNIPTIDEISKNFNRDDIADIKSSKIICSNNNNEPVFVKESCIKQEINKSNNEDKTSKMGDTYRFCNENISFYKSNYQFNDDLLSYTPGNNVPNRKHIIDQNVPVTKKDLHLKKDALKFNVGMDVNVENVGIPSKSNDPSLITNSDGNGVFKLSDNMKKSIVADLYINNKVDSPQSNIAKKVDDWSMQNEEKNLEVNFKSNNKDCDEPKLRKTESNDNCDFEVIEKEDYIDH